MQPGKWHRVVLTAEAPRAAGNVAVYLDGQLALRVKIDQPLIDKLALECKAPLGRLDDFAVSHSSSHSASDSLRIHRSTDVA